MVFLTVSKKVRRATIVSMHLLFDIVRFMNASLFILVDLLFAIYYDIEKGVFK